MKIKEAVKKYKVPAAAGLSAALFWLYSLSEEDAVPPLPEQAIVENELIEENTGTLSPKPAPAAEVAVDVKGAVEKPGIYILSSENRVNDAINKAGGATEKANTAAINLAQRVHDEMMIYVPQKGEDAPAEAPSSGASAGAFNRAGSGGEKGLVNINTADAAELQELPGIGESKAQAIIDQRKTEGPFTAIEELKNVTGIGEKTFEKLAPLIMAQ